MVFETLGAINEEGEDVLRSLFRYAAKRLGLEFSSYCARAWARFSCTLQRSVSQSILTRIDGREFREPPPLAQPTATTTTTAYSTASVTPTVTSTTSLPSVRVFHRAPNRQSSGPRETERTEREKREKQDHQDSSLPREREEKSEHPLSLYISEKDKEEQRDLHPLALCISQGAADTRGNTRTSPLSTSPTRAYTHTNRQGGNTPSRHDTLDTLGNDSSQCGSMRGTSGSSMSFVSMGDLPCALAVKH
jgi:hypothetical protein